MWIDKQSDDIFFLRFLASSRAEPYLRFWYLEPFRVDLSAVFPMYIFFIFPSSLCIHGAQCVAVAMRDSALRSVWRTYVFPVEAERGCLSVWSLPTEHRDSACSHTDSIDQVWMTSSALVAPYNP